tara:strand:- start:4318 stop:5130 length:813 start_codon:yes stop_codon:yes gene_type:complete
LVRLDQNPSKLIDWINTAPSPRLGLMFERYWQYYWANHTDNDLWAFNRQLHRNGRTLGELDALRWSSSIGALDHYELAVKFYLQLPKTALGTPPDTAKSLPESTQWVGPNVIDWLHKKYQQMRDQQLRSLTPDTLKDWMPWPIEQKVPRLRTHMIFKGRLFYQLDDDQPPLFEPYINPEHDFGYWLNLKRWHCLEERPYWLMLDKHEWLAPLQAVPPERILSHQQTREALRDYFGRHDSPIQVISLLEGSNNWQESERFFVVPEQWPSAQ